MIKNGFLGFLGLGGAIKLERGPLLGEVYTRSTSELGDDGLHLRAGHGCFLPV